MATVPRGRICQVISRTNNRNSQADWCKVVTSSSRRMQIRAVAGPVAGDDFFAVPLTRNRAPTARAGAYCGRKIRDVLRVHAFTGIIFLCLERTKFCIPIVVSRGRSAGPEIRPSRQLLKRRAYSIDSHPKMLYRGAAICRSVTEAGVFPC
jgi:hypothetical protein